MLATKGTLQLLTTLKVIFLNFLKQKTSRHNRMVKTIITVRPMRKAINNRNVGSECLILAPLPYPQVGGPVGGIAPKASPLTSTLAYSPGHRFYQGGPGTQFPGMLVVIGGLLEFILGNTYTFDVFSLKASRISKPT